MGGGNVRGAAVNNGAYGVQLTRYHSYDGCTPEKQSLWGDCVQNVPCSAVLFTACCYRVSVVFAWYNYYVKEYQCFSYSMIVSWKNSTSYWVKYLQIIMTMIFTEEAKLNCEICQVWKKKTRKFHTL